MNFSLGLAQISNNFQSGPKLTSAILYTYLCKAESSVLVITESNQSTLKKH